ncbi:hypothetical protein LZ554_002116 [Drepanopeziza brunnea f. sp. 'monogermtubi']|nr:hypothetical protein LZ554_002116 [Drepanopeziza brunnea f. sp. 'monogermtubi']
MEGAEYHWKQSDGNLNLYTDVTKMFATLQYSSHGTIPRREHYTHLVCPCGPVLDNRPSNHAFHHNPP